LGHEVPAAPRQRHTQGGWVVRPGVQALGQLPAAHHVAWKKQTANAQTKPRLKAVDHERVKKEILNYENEKMHLNKHQFKKAIVATGLCIGKNSFSASKDSFQKTPYR